MNTNKLLYQWPPFRFKTISFRCRSALISLSWHRECVPAKCQLNGRSQTACPDSEKQVCTRDQMPSHSWPKYTHTHTHTQHSHLFIPTVSRTCSAQRLQGNNVEHRFIFFLCPTCLNVSAASCPAGEICPGCKQIPRQHAVVLTCMSIKDKSTQKLGFSNCLLTSMLMESQAKFLSPQNRYHRYHLHFRRTCMLTLLAQQLQWRFVL